MKKLRLFVNITIPLIFLVVWVPHLIPSLNKVTVETSEPIALYEYLEPEAMASGDDHEGMAEREMESMPAMEELGPIAKIWSPIKRVISETKEILSTLLLVFNIKAHFKRRKKR